ncbi:MAG TPA: PIN domain-containing protein [Syntrophales bacterium]|nr:PIN domain-containing protein [Syntrophobacterales bacterium]HNQ01890.1 PIN domain-containing protein [Syntrophales bacterium]HQL90175.1 PIN domain-containing protein [Syntrophales bacterium]
MIERVFVDTNVLIYAHDLDAGLKHDRAAAILSDLWEKENGIVSVQVLQEFYVNVTRKISAPLTPALARGVIRNYLAWQIAPNDPSTVLSASEIAERNHISFWDALIVASASNAGADRILSEDLNHGQMIEGVVIENPFL